MKGKRLLIAGAAGQIGRGLVWRLAPHNEVHALDLFPEPAVKQEVEDAGAIAWHKDLLSDDLGDMPRHLDAVFNMAVFWARQPGWESQQRAHQVNGLGAARLLRRFGDGAAFVQGSTGGLYRHGNHRCREDHTELLIDGYYHEGKFAAETLVDFLCRDFGRRAAVLRYFWPYAPYDRSHGISELYAQLQAGQPPTWESDRIAPIYISDVVDKTIAAADRADSPPALYNIGNPAIATRTEIIQLICDLAGFSVPDDLPVPRDLNFLPDTTRMDQALGPARVTWQDGVRRVHRAFQHNATRPLPWMFA